LEDALRLLSEQHQVPIQFNRRALESEKIDPRTLVSIKLADVSLGTALECLLRNVDLSYSQKFESLLVAPAKQIDQENIVRAYSVPDLQAPTQSLPGDALDRVLSRLPTRSIQAGGFHGGGIPRDNALHKSLEMCLSHRYPKFGQLDGEFGSSVIVSGSRDTLLDVEELLRDLRPGSSPTEPPPSKKLVAALSKPVTLHCRESLPREIASQLSLQLEVPVWLDPMLNHWIWLIDRINCDVDNRPLAELMALQIFSETVYSPDPFGESPTDPFGESPMPLEIVVRGDALLITARGMKQSASAATVYDVRDLLGRFPELERRPLIELVGMVVAPTSWASHVRPAEIRAGLKLGNYSEATMEVFRDNLVVRNHLSNRRDVERFLNWLKEDKHGLPHPSELAQTENHEAVQRLLAGIRTSSDPLCRSYSVVLLSRLENPAPEVAALLVELISVGEVETNEEFEFQVCAALHHCGPAAAGALPALESKLMGATYLWQKQRYVQTIAALGPQAIPVLVRAMDTHDRGQLHCVLEQFVKTGPHAVDAVPPLLKKLTINYSEQNKSIITVIAAVDPQWQRARQELDQWAEGSDENLRNRSREIKVMLNKGEQNE
jgi:hypothetical protein